MPLQISGVITVTTAGTAVAGPSTSAGTFQLVASGANTGTYCYVGNDGNDDVAAANGYELSKTGSPLVISVSNLNQVYFDSDTNGDKIAWIRVVGDQHGIYPPTA